MMAKQQRGTQVTKQQFATYIAAFNNDDFAGFTAYYADDVLLELGARQIRGRTGIESFYRDVKSKIKETLVIRQVIADEDGLATEIDTTFEALADWPDFIAGAMKKGDIIRIVSFVLYRIEHGKFTHIRSARFLGQRA